MVAPGFIDVHNHTPEVVSDEAKRGNDGFVRQGVTTVVIGPDGSAGPSQIRPFIQLLNREGAGTNFATYVGHNAVRRRVMSDSRDAPTPEQMVEMKALVREGMELGAVGLSTGLMYEPGMWSTTDEVVELAKVVQPFEGIYDSHVRDPAKRFVWSHSEAIEIGRRAGIPSKLGHLKSVGLDNEGRIREIIERVEEANASGHMVTSDQYPYDGAATSTLLPSQPFPGAAVIVVPPELLQGVSFSDFDLRGALENKETRARIRFVSENGVEDGFAWLKATGYRAMRIVNSQDYPDLVGLYLYEIAEKRRVEPFDAIADLAVSAEHPVYVTLGAIKEWEVAELVRQPWNMIASDGEYLEPDAKAGHPRSTGTFPRLFSRYVREQKLISLEEAVRKVTSFPADFLGLADRGRAIDGAIADLVIFDPETIEDRSTWTEPGLRAVGVHHVLVGGQFVLREGKMTGLLPGRFVRMDRTPRP